MPVDRSNLEEIVQRKLGQSLDPIKLDAILAIQNNLETTKQRIMKEESGESYLHKMHAAITHAHNDLALILGHDDLQTIFGEADPIAVPDKKAFMTSTKS